MSWNTPTDWDYKEAPGSSKMNAQIRDNLNYLKESMPPGIIMPYAGASAPTQWLLCDGSAISRSTYSALFAIIGTTYGSGDGSSTFNVPNLKGKIPVGKNSAESEFDTLGETGGTKTHTLAVGEIPSHNHGGVTTTENQNHTHGPASGVQFMETIASGGTLDRNSGSNVVISNNTGVNSVNHTHQISSQGGGGAHNNLQPYLVLNYIIKY